MKAYVIFGLKTRQKQQPNLRILKTSTIEMWFNEKLILYLCLSKQIEK
jgi:hypothetical protein